MTVSLSNVPPHIKAHIRHYAFCVISERFGLGCSFKSPLCSSIPPAVVVDLLVVDDICICTPLTIPGLSGSSIIVWRGVQDRSMKPKVTVRAAAAGRQPRTGKASGYLSSMTTPAHTYFFRTHVTELNNRGRPGYRYLSAYIRAAVNKNGSRP